MIQALTGHTVMDCTATAKNHTFAARPFDRFLRQPHFQRRPEHARIPESEIEGLKQDVSLARLVEAKGIELKRHGADLLGLCPFHDDREPSLVVSPKKNLWHCLGTCQAGSTVIDWVMRVEGLSFRHAVELLEEGRPSLDNS